MGGANGSGVEGGAGVDESQGGMGASSVAVDVAQAAADALPAPEGGRTAAEPSSTAADLPFPAMAADVPFPSTAADVPFPAMAADVPFPSTATGVPFPSTAAATTSLSLALTVTEEAAATEEAPRQAQLDDLEWQIEVIMRQHAEDCKRMNPSDAARFAKQALSAVGLRASALADDVRSPSSPSSVLPPRTPSVWVGALPV